MDKNYLANRHNKSYFSLHLQGPVYDDHALAISTDAPSAYNACYVKAIPRDKKDPRQAFLLIPETKNSDDSFRIFNKCNGKAWTMLNVTGSYFDMVVEKDLDPNDETRSQLFNIQDAPNGKKGEIQIISSVESAYGCANDSADILIHRHIKALGKASRLSKRFLLSPNGNIVPPEISNEGNLESVAPSLDKLSLDKAGLKKPLATRVIRLPFFMVEDKAKTTAWKVQNSPWYYLRRELRLVYDLAWFIHNDTSVTQERVNTTESGATQSTKHSINASIGVELSTHLNFFGNGADLTISATLGYGVDFFSSTTSKVQDTLKLVAPPYSDVTMFQMQSKLDLLRSDGTVVTSWGVPDKALHYKSVSLKDQTVKRFTLNEGEDTARVVTDDNELGDVSPIARRVSSVPLET